jgi:hypothetical protein
VRHSALVRHSVTGAAEGMRPMANTEAPQEHLALCVRARDRESTDLRPQLAAAGVHLAFSSTQHYVAVELRVPDGRTLTSLVEGMPHR